MGALDFRFHRGGVHLPELKLWLDAHEAIGPEELAFVSHAHSDHTARHARVLLTRPTQALMRSRVSGQRDEIVLPFGQRIPLPEFPDAAVTLVPAGHILGSAMILIEAGDDSLLYTGDFKLRRGLAAEVCEPRQANKLIMETTFGLPKYVFPPSEDVIKGIVRFCREALDHGEIPVLLGYSLGKCQEMLCALREAGFPIMLHPQAAKLTAIYSQFGVTFPEYEELDPVGASTYVVLAPPGVSLVPLQRNRPPLRTAMLTGWALDAGAQFQYRVGKAFPLSDHADFPDLLEFVRQVSPKEVFTLHGFAAEFAATLRRQGIAAQALGATEQLELGLARSGAFSAPAAPAGTAAAVDATTAHSELDAGSFSGFAHACVNIAAASGKAEKTAALANYLHIVPSGDLGTVVRWFCGSLNLPGARRPLPLGWAVLRPALCTALGVDAEALQAACVQHGDSAEAAELLFSAKGRAKVGSRTLAEVAIQFEELALAQTLPRKRSLATRLFQQSSPTEAKFLVKLFSGDLRIGLNETVLENAVSSAFGATPDRVARAHWLTSDLGETASLAKSDRLEASLLRPLRPIRLMFGATEANSTKAARQVRQWPPTAGENIGVTGMAWIEPELEGIRCQAHKVGPKVHLYTGELQEITDSVPELVTALRQFPCDVVLDGEVLMTEDGRLLTLNDLQKRVKGGQAELFAPVATLFVFSVFDLLWLDGARLIDDTLAERRRWLESLSWSQPLVLSEIQKLPSPESVESVLTHGSTTGWRIRNPASPYRPGQHSNAWLRVEAEVKETTRSA